MTEEKNIPENFRIKSFVKREGRMTQGQDRAMEAHWPTFGVEYNADATIDFKALFGNDNPVVVEVGFGMGKSLAEMAKNFPENNYLGIEVHRPGVATLLKDIAEMELTNLRVMCHDAVEVFENMLAEQSVDRMQLFFPDPWHKKKHNKRRIVKPEFVTTVASRMKTGGVFHMATDWEDYALQMMEVMSEHADYKNQCGDQQYAPRPDYRPLTKFEARGHRLGHGVWDLLFERV